MLYNVIHFKQIKINRRSKINKYLRSWKQKDFFTCRNVLFWAIISILQYILIYQNSFQHVLIKFSNIFFEGGGVSLVIPFYNSCLWDMKWKCTRTRKTSFFLLIFFIGSIFNIVTFETVEKYTNKKHLKMFFGKHDENLWKTR